jgi:hypothetical protein
MGDLDADDRVAVGDREVGRSLGVHLVKVLFVGVTGHAGAADVQENQYAGTGSIDDGFLKLRKVMAA